MNIKKIAGYGIFVALYGGLFAAIVKDSSVEIAFQTMGVTTVIVGAVFLAAKLISD